uniref:Uncharacterized protein n=1 Tax=Gasterosteus aculeatus aculeatus TaxID=481459 RepID=A0AAQ4S4U2_GASAC
MSTDCQKTTAKVVPSTRRVTITDHMPPDCSTTPGGTLFSTTPVYNRTRIICDRKFLLACRSSPVAKTPPCGLPKIPGVTIPPSEDNVKRTMREKSQTTI